MFLQVLRLHRRVVHYLTLLEKYQKPYPTHKKLLTSFYQCISGLLHDELYVVMVLQLYILENLISQCALYDTRIDQTNVKAL